MFQQEEGSDLVGRVFLSLERDTRDSALDPTSGYDVELYGALTSRGLGASHDWYKLELKGVNYLPFFGKRSSLMTGFKSGPSHVQQRFGAVYDAISRRRRLRAGFPLPSIGPTDERPTIMAESMYLLTAELAPSLYKMVAAPFS